MKKKMLLIMFPLILGLTIYICFRSKSLFYFKIFNYLNFKEDILELRRVAFTHRKLIPNWVIYSLPDGLWIFSFGIAFLYNLDNYRKRLVIFTGIMLFMLVFEYIQLFYGGHGKLIGTYDDADLYCFLGGYTASVLITLLRILVRKKYAEKIYIKKSYFRVLRDSIGIVILFIILAVLPTLN